MSSPKCWNGKNNWFKDADFDQSILERLSICSCSSSGSIPSLLSLSCFQIYSNYRFHYTYKKNPFRHTAYLLLVHVFYFTILCKKQVLRPASSLLGIYTLKIIFVELLTLFFLVGSLYPKFLSRASRSFLD